MNQLKVPVADKTIDAQWDDGNRVRRGLAWHHGDVHQIPKADATILEAAWKALSSTRERPGRIRGNPGVSRGSQDEANQASPEASDLAEPASRQEYTTYRILRDTTLARRIKTLHKHKCQICNRTIVLPDGSRYSEAHHIQPLGSPHDGHDVMGNIICVCPNHHAELDYGVRRLSAKNLRATAGHSVSETYIRYHNDRIYGRGAEPAG